MSAVLIFVSCDDKKQYYTHKYNYDEKCNISLETYVENISETLRKSCLSLNFISVEENNTGTSVSRLLEKRCPDIEIFRNL